MPLDNVARRYADSLFNGSLEDIVKQQQAKLVEVRRDHAARNMVASGPNIAAQARILIAQVQLLGEARSDSLLRSYQRAGLPFDDAAFNEVKTEVMGFCHSQQHHAVSAIVRSIGTAFSGQQPPNLQEAVVEEIINGVSGVMSRLARNLSIKTR